MIKPRNPRIVVIDDDDSVSDAIRMLVELQGWTAISYRSCEGFLAEFSVDDPPSCIILDLHFPKMNGTQLQRQLTQSGVRVPTIVLTARPDSPLAASALQAGAREIITKPVDGDELIQKITSALDDTAGPMSRQLF